MLFQVIEKEFERVQVLASGGKNLIVTPNASSGAGATGL
jgi:hypothetical protein